MTGGHFTAVLPVIGVHSLYKDTCMLFCQKKMCDYSNGKIYKVLSPNHSLVYYGSTVQTLEQRMVHHRCTGNKATSKQIVAAGDAVIELIEKYPCMNKHELEDREAEVMQADWDGCVNEMVPGVIRRAGGMKAYQKEYKKEWYEENRVKLRAQHREYYGNNAEKVKARQNEKHQCECGGKFTHVNKARHFRSKKHQAHISSQSPV